jgi:hypothetical protein
MVHDDRLGDVVISTTPTAIALLASGQQDGQHYY